VTLRERLAALDRAQHARWFKIAASILILLLAIGGFATYFVAVTSGAGGPPELTLPEGVSPEVAAQIQRQRDQIAMLLDAKDSTTLAGVAAAAFAVVALAVVWLGLGLTYGALLLVAGLLAVPMMLSPALAVYGRVLLGVVALTMAFTVLMRVLRLAFGWSGPVAAVARNVLAEATRLRLSMVFIVLLILGLSVLPQLLNDDQPLRYRVQAFLQYATGGAFWLTAILVLFFSVATVAFEQRDKIIWQTATKPVAAWQFLLGKWLGVVSLAAVLLAVSSTGVFLFTEYLRGQPALGESAPFVSASSNEDVTEDRLLLETQVLTARRVIAPEVPFTLDSPELATAVDRYIENERVQRPEFGRTAAERREVALQLLNEAVAQYRAIEPREGREVFTFRGLGAARDGGLMTLRYKVDAEGNRPDTFYALTFAFADGTVIPRERTALGLSHTLTLSPDFVGDDGTMEIAVYNGLLVPTPEGNVAFLPNPQTATIPPDGMQVSYAVGSYRMNYVRVVFVLWVKLAFLAALGVWAATYLSFPVASLLALGTFFIAEGATFVLGSVDRFGTNDIEGNFRVWRWVVSNVAEAVSKLFIVYSELKPTSRLADGRLLGWGDVAYGTLVLGGLTGVLFFTGVLIFRRRELATYSGQ
jgi:hypothetical protein